LSTRRLYSREEVARLMWRYKCVHVRDYETGSRWKARNGFQFTIPEIGPDRQVTTEDLTDVEADLQAMGIKP
jgi:hypothetical protein